VTAKLELQNICRVFDGVTVVDDLSVRLISGEVTCLLGPSGCGKSTTLRIAAGVDRQTSGRVLLDGQVISDDSIHLPPEKRSIGLMFQDFALFPHLSVVENVAFGLKSANKRELSLVLLDKVGLKHAAEKFPHMLSGGRATARGAGAGLGPQSFRDADGRTL